MTDPTPRLSEIEASLKITHIHGDSRAPCWRELEALGQLREAVKIARALQSDLGEARAEADDAKRLVKILEKESEDNRQAYLKKRAEADALRAAGKDFLAHLSDPEGMDHPCYVLIEGAGPKHDGPTVCSEYLAFEKALTRPSQSSGTAKAEKPREAGKSPTQTAEEPAAASSGGPCHAIHATIARTGERWGSKKETPYFGAATKWELCDPEPEPEACPGVVHTQELLYPYENKSSPSQVVVRIDAHCPACPSRGSSA